MAKPRIFISSTFYDLQQIRYELDKFIESFGYEPVRNEEGDIPYDKDDELQEYCYKEISNVDILISVIGGRYGSKALSSEERSTSEYSVTQKEIKTALEKNKLVYLFIEKNVLTEYETYVLNRGKDDVQYKFVDNVNIYKFLDEIKSLSRNNNIKGFGTADEIKSYLKEQWAGLFKQYITDAEKYQEQKVLSDINETAKVLRGLVDYLKESNEDKNASINDIIKTNHPIVSRLKELLEIPYNFYIEGKKDFMALLNARRFSYNEKTQIWTSQQRKTQIVVNNDIFDEDGNLRYYKPSEWKDEWIELRTVEEEIIDLPF
jgi:hypothetical protein